MLENSATITVSFPDDTSLIRGIAAQDVQSFNQFVAKYQQFVMTVCYNMVNNRDEIEDLAQEVFLKVYRHADRFRGESQVRTWLYRIAVNTALNHKRKQRIPRWLDLFKNSNGNAFDDLCHVPSTDNRPDRLLERAERRQILYRALDQLAEKQRTAIILHKFEGLSYKEIAEIMKISLSAVESIIHRAKKNLQKKLWKFITQ